MSRYFVFGAASLSLLLVSISGSAVAVAFPNIISAFDTSLILAGWVLSINQLVATAVMPLAGKAGDIFGGKLTFMVSILVFTIGSLLCALATNIEFLIAARLVQAIGAGSFLPLATGIVSDQFPRARQRAIGFFSSIFPIGMIIGPNLGGWLVEAFGWRSIFWFNIPLGVITFVASAFLLRARKREGGNMDLMGAGLFTGSLSAFLVAFSEIGNSQDKSSWFLPGLLFAAAIVFMFFFIRHESSNKNPIIDLQVLKERPFLAANIFNLLYGMCVLGIMSFIPLYATSVYGMSTLESGLIMTPRSVGMIAASAITSIFLTRWGYRLPMLIGTGAVVISLVLLGIASPVINALGIQASATVLLVVFMLLTGIGMGMIAPAANNACIELMPHRVATITGVRGMFRQSGGATTIAVTSLLLHNTSDISHGFTVVFIGLASILVLTTPLVFAMPRAPGAPATEEASNQGT